MLSFKILKQSEKSRARLGLIETPHGEVETPAFVPVATRASVRMLDTEEVRESGAQMLIANTFHLHLAPGEKVVKKAGGLHAFMRWNGPLMTDSGGFQVYSWGFGEDHGIGKMLKKPREAAEKGATFFRVGETARPRSVKITEEGVEFPSPVDGARTFLGPRESVKIQEALGADIIFAFDECPSPLADEAYMRRSLEKTHRWARECIRAKRTGQALFGIVQGGKFPRLRQESARVIGAMDFQGFGIGGEFGYDKRGMERIVGRVTDALPREKPRHLLGVGHPEDFAYIARAGIDTFDCIAPTHYARRGIAFTSEGKSDLRSPALVKRTDRPLDPSCACPVCATYSLGYMAHLVRARELSGLMLATTHNMHYFNALAAKIRTLIGSGEI